MEKNMSKPEPEAVYFGTGAASGTSTPTENVAHSKMDKSKDASGSWMSESPLPPKREPIYSVLAPSAVKSQNSVNTGSSKADCDELEKMEVDEQNKKQQRKVEKVEAKDEEPMEVDIDSDSVAPWMRSSLPAKPTGSKASAAVKPGNVTAPTQLKSSGISSTPVKPPIRAPSTPVKPSSAAPTPKGPGSVPPTSIRPSGAAPTTVTPGNVTHSPIKSSNATNPEGPRETSTLKRAGVDKPPPMIPGNVPLSPITPFGTSATPGSSVAPTPSRITSTPSTAAPTPSNVTPSSSVAPTPSRVAPTPARPSDVKPTTAVSGNRTLTRVPPGEKTPVSDKPENVGSGRDTPKSVKSSKDYQHAFSHMTVAAVMEQLANILESSHLDRNIMDNTETQYALMAVIDIVDKLDQLHISQSLPQVGGVGKVTGSPYARMTLGDIIRHLEQIAQSLGTLEALEGPPDYLEVTVSEMMYKLEKLIGEPDSDKKKAYTETPYAHMTFGDIMKIATQKLQVEDEELDSLYERVSVSDMIHKFEKLSGIHGSPKTREYLMKVPYTTMSVAGVATKLMQIVDIIEQAGKGNSEAKGSMMTLREVLPFLETIVGAPLTTLAQVDPLDSQEDQRGDFMECAYARLSVMRMIEIFEQLAKLYFNMSKSTTKDFTKFTIADIICHSDNVRSVESTEILWALMNVASIIYKFEELAAGIDSAELEKIIKNKKIADETERLNRSRTASEAGKRVREVGSLLRNEDSEDSTAFYTCTTTTHSSRQDLIDSKDKQFLRYPELKGRLQMIRKEYTSPSSSSSASSSSSSTSITDKDQSDKVKLGANDSKKKIAPSGLTAAVQAKDKISDPNADQTLPDWSHLQLITKYYPPTIGEDQPPKTTPAADKNVPPTPKRVVIKDHDQKDNRQEKQHPQKDTNTSCQGGTLATLPTQTVTMSGDAIMASAENEILNVTCDLNENTSPNDSHRVIATMTGLGTKMIVADLTISVVDTANEEQDNRDSEPSTTGIHDRTYTVNDPATGIRDRTYTVNDPATGIRDRTYTVNDRTGGIRDRTFTVNDRTSGIRDRTYTVNDPATRIRDRTYTVNDRTSGIRDRTYTVNDLRAITGQNEETSTRTGMNSKHQSQSSASHKKDIKVPNNTPISRRNRGKGRVEKIPPKIFKGPRRPDKDSQPSGSFPSSVSNKIPGDRKPRSNRDEILRKLFKGSRRPDKDSQPSGSSPSSVSNKIPGNRKPRSHREKILRELIKGPGRPDKDSQPSGSSPSSSSNKLTGDRKPRPHRDEFRRKVKVPQRPDKDSQPSGSSPSSSSNRITSDRNPHPHRGGTTGNKTKSSKSFTQNSTKKDVRRADKYLFVRPARSSSSGSDEMKDITLDFRSPGSSASSCCDREMPTDIQVLRQNRSDSSCSSSGDDLHNRVMFVRPTRSTSSGSDVEEMDDTLLVHAANSSCSNSSGEFDIRELPYILELTKRELNSKKAVRRW